MSRLKITPSQPHPFCCLHSTPQPTPTLIFPPLATQFCDSSPRNGVQPVTENAELLFCDHEKRKNRSGRKILEYMSFPEKWQFLQRYKNLCHRIFLFLKDATKQQPLFSCAYAASLLPLLPQTTNAGWWRSLAPLKGDPLICANFSSPSSANSFWGLPPSLAAGAKGEGPRRWGRRSSTNLLSFCIQDVCLVYCHVFLGKLLRKHYGLVNPHPMISGTLLLLSPKAPSTHGEGGEKGWRRHPLHPSQLFLFSLPLPLSHSFPRLHGKMIWHLATVHLF